MNKIKSSFVDYNDNALIEKIGKERIEERLCAIHDIYEVFLQEAKLVDGEDVCLNDRTVMHTILDYFTDITRLKEFHDIEKINGDKIIAYESGWLLKRKPIQILADNREELVYVNEKFVLTILVNHITNGQIDNFGKNVILKNFCDSLFYHLKYRNCEPKVLEILIAAFKAGNSVEKIEYTNRK